jgi:hypothetical protein
MLERVIDKPATKEMYGRLSIDPPKMINEKELYGC